MKFGKDYDRKWNRWFAWYPIKVGTKLVWLEYVDAYYNSYWHYWSYREIQK